MQEKKIQALNAERVWRSLDTMKSGTIYYIQLLLQGSMLKGRNDQSCGAVLIFVFIFAKIYDVKQT